MTLLQLDQFNLSCKKPLVFFVSLLNIGSNSSVDTLRAPTTWSHIEICAAVVSACLPTLRPIIMLFMTIVGFSKTNSQGKSGTWKSRNSGRRETGTRATSRPFKHLHDPETWPPEVDESSDKIPLNIIKVRTDVVQNKSLGGEDKHETEVGKGG